jgi:hypothetical protein
MGLDRLRYEWSSAHLCGCPLSEETWGGVPNIQSAVSPAKMTFSEIWCPDCPVFY